MKTFKKILECLIYKQTKIKNKAKSEFLISHIAKHTTNFTSPYQKTI